MNPSFQTIGWADMVICEDARDPNDYNLGDNDPYNTDDDVVDDLFDQWLKTGRGVEPSVHMREELELAFELGAQLAMTGQYHSEKGETFRVTPEAPNSSYGKAKSAALRDHGLIDGFYDPRQGINDVHGAFHAGYKALSPSKGE